MGLFKTITLQIGAFLLIFASAVALTSFSGAVARAAETSRFDELVIWKLTDALKLDPETEQRFDQTLRSLNTRKKSATEALDAATDDLKRGTSAKEMEGKLAHYRAALAIVQKLQLSEIDEIQRLLGTRKVAEYLALKSEMTDKIKEALLDPQNGSVSAVGTGGSATRAITKVSPTPLPTPRLIEE